MGRGGRRPGAGRKQGSVTTRTREIAEQAIEQGVTPLDVILDNMRFYHGAAESALRRMLEGLATPSQIIEEHAPGQIGPDKPPPSPVDAFKVMLALREKAGKEAERAAPYIHPRITPSDGSDANDRDYVPLAERLAEYDRETAIEQSGGKVVALALPAAKKPTPASKRKGRK